MTDQKQTRSLIKNIHRQSQTNVNMIDDRSTDRMIDIPPIGFYFDSRTANKETYMWTEPHAALVENAFEEFAAAMGENVTLQPFARTRFASVYFAISPAAGERSRLWVHMLLLQVIDEIGAGFTFRMASIPIACADDAAIGAMRTVGKLACWKTNGLRLRQNRTFGAIGQRKIRQIGIDGGGCVQQFQTATAHCRRANIGDIESADRILLDFLEQYALRWGRWLFHQEDRRRL